MVLETSINNKQIRDTSSAVVWQVAYRSVMGTVAKI